MKCTCHEQYHRCDFCEERRKVNVVIGMASFEKIYRMSEYELAEQYYGLTKKEYETMKRKHYGQK